MSQLNFGDLFDAVARAIPQQPAIVHGDLVLSWRELDERSNRLARQLQALGLQPGSKVAFYLRNSPAYIELYAACFKARLVHVNVNYRYVDSELRYIFENSDAEAIVYDPEFRGRISALRAQLPNVRAYIETGTAVEAADVLSFEALCATGDASPLTVARSADDLYFMYTGGTTGVPKAVMWPHGNRIEVIGMADAENADAHAAAVAAAPSRPIVLPACPMMHSTGFTSSLSALVNGGCVVLLPSPRFDAAECLQVIDRWRVESVALVGDAFSVPLLEELRKRAARYDLSSVRAFASAGAMWSSVYKRELLTYFPKAVIRDSLGSSEGSRLAGSEMRQGDDLATGRFKLGPNTKVFTEEFREVEPGSGEAGLIATCGPIPLGYYKDVARTRQTFPVVDGVRYSIPGDWCTVDADGYINLLGRGSNCINSGGEKIFPEEVEDALKSHPSVRDAAVFGVADPRWGQAVAAVVQLWHEDPAAEAELRGHLRAMLAAYKIPRHVHCVTTAFRAENGKMDYDRVKALYAGE